MRLASVLTGALTGLVLLSVLCAAQEAFTPSVSPQLDWTVAKAAAARVDVLGPGGASLRQTYGVVLGDPPRLVVHLTDLAGAEKVIATFRANKRVEFAGSYATDGAQDIAVLDSDPTLPPPPEPALMIHWRLNAKVYVIPGPDMGETASELMVSEPMEVGSSRLIPLSGDLPGGLPVMDVQGKWIGISGRIEDASGRFTFLTSSEQIIPVLFGSPTPMPIPQLKTTPPVWQDPRGASGLLVRAVLRGFQKPEEAAPFFELALQRAPAMPEIYFWMGKNAFRRQQFAEAETSFRETARLKPGWAIAYHMAGAAANQQGHYDVALDLYNQGLKVNPNSAMTLTNKAGALYNLGRVEESIEVLKHATEVDSTYAMAVHNLGVTYTTLGRWTDAEAQYVKLQSLDKYLAKSLRDRIDGK